MHSMLAYKCLDDRVESCKLAEQAYQKRGTFYLALQWKSNNGFPQKQ